MMHATNQGRARKEAENVGMQLQLNNLRQSSVSHDHLNKKTARPPEV